MNTLNLLLVDDEREACINLQNILSEYVDKKINILGVAHSTKEAEQKIMLLKPDAIFLDIEMPNENAFQFLERIQPVDFEIVFITAYDEYAIQAFKLNAVDYILKPINIEDLKKAIGKLRDRILFRRLKNSTPDEYGKLAALINQKKKQSQIVLKDKNEVEVVSFKDIISVTAMGSYAKVIFKKEHKERSIVMSNSISEYEDLLPPEMFYRIHKSYLVNAFFIKSVTREEQAYAILTDNTRLPVGRRRLAGLMQFLKNYKILDV